MMTKFHYFINCNSSSYPLILSLNSFSLFVSLLMFFKNFNLFMLIFSFLNLVMCSFVWWVDFYKTFNHKGEVGEIFEKGLKFSFILFIFSEIFFFFSFFWSYFHFYLSPTLETGVSWPPLSVSMFNVLDVPLLNTMILLTSGVSLTVSHYFFISGKKFLMEFLLLQTIFLGIFFSTVQGMEYMMASFSLNEGVFQTCFFLLTGFHGLHVIFGFFFLFVILLGSFNFSLKNNSCTGFELASWYWHFVDIVWIFLYSIIYFYSIN